MNESSIQSILSAIENQHGKFPVEKLYLQTDKSNYLQNDTLWFKSYLLNGDYLAASTRSGLLYVELDDSTGTPVKRIMIPLLAGLGRGQVTLDEKTFPKGVYTLRAYTNWMRNFGEDYLFKKRVYIASAEMHAHLIKAEFKATTRADKTNIHANILFTDINNTPALLQKMRLKVHDDSHTLLRSDLLTDIAGRLDINFDIPARQSTKSLYITTQDVAAKSEIKSPVYTIPVILDRPVNIDLQFMPESGGLIAGIPARVGFKAIGEDGNGIAVSGRVYDNRHQVVSQFHSTHLGMGSFYLYPVQGEAYTASVDLPGGLTKTFRLPAVHASGASMQVSSIGNDSVKVTVFVIPGSVDHNPGYNLLGLSRGVVCYAARLKMKDTISICRVPKSSFPAGIAHFTLLTNSGVPLAERMVYIDHHDNLQISITPDKKTYAPHDSVALKIRVTDKAGNPVQGSFSMAVTDDSQVRQDSAGTNLLNNLLLTSDLKGNVEQPGYYFEDSSRQRMADLDNLLLTQGWVGYDWEQIFGPGKQPLFLAEKEYTVQGRVVNMFNKPVANAPVTLLSPKPIMALDTTTDKNGRFVFRGFLPVDTAAFMVQARNKKEKSNNVSVEIDEFKPPVFKADTGLFIPWYVNTDTLLLHTIANKITTLQAAAKLQGIVLKEVKINDKKIIRTSKNLNGPGEADQTLDEKDMEKAGKLTLEDVLKQKVKGFQAGYVKKSPFLIFKVFDEPAKFVIDGMYLDRFYTPMGGYNSYYEYVKGILNGFTAEDIAGIEVMYNPGYNARYILAFLSPWQLSHPIAFIEITTRGGHGPFNNTTPGTYLYKPLAVSLPKQFYRPRYTPNTTVTYLDLRPTIHWEPDIVTDANGRATVFFYSADKPGSYTVLMEGADLNGLIGSSVSKLQVK